MTALRRLTLAALILASPAWASARPAEGPPPRPPVRRLLEEMDLTPEQQRQLLQLRRTRGREQAQLGPQIRARRRELADLYRAYPLDEARASALIRQIAQLETSRLRVQLRHQAELRRILTRDQFERFTRMLEDRTPAPPPRVPPP